MSKPLKPIVDVHIHSHYSLLDGVSSPEKNVERAKELGAPAVGISDHGVVSGIYEHYWACKKAGIKPIIGCELYLTEDHDDMTTHYFHGIAIAMNEVGFRNVVYLSSLSNSPKHFKHRRPCVSFKELFEHSEGVLFSTGCMVGIVGVSRRRRPITKRVVLPSGVESVEYGEWSRGPWNPDEAKAVFKQFKDVFGDRMVVEVGPARIDRTWTKSEWWENETTPDGTKRVKRVTWDWKVHEEEEPCLQAQHNKRAMALANIFKIPVITASDAHMCHPALKEVQDILMINSPGNTNGWHFHQTHAMLGTEETWELYQKNHPYISRERFESFVENTHKLNERIEDYELKFPVLVPKFPVPEGKTSREVLDQMIKETGRVDLNNPVYKARLEEEKRVICDNGMADYTDYFLILADIVKAVQKAGVGVGPARGSAGGCLLSYALGITSIDPIKYGLDFVRFLNEGRLKSGHPPDIDMDFTDRGPVVKYIFQRYGYEHAAMVGAFQTVKTKAALKDIVRAMNGGHLDGKDKVHEICRTIGTAPQYYPSEKQFLEGFWDDDGNRHPGLLETNEQLSNYLKDNPRVNKLFWDMLQTPRHMSKHAGGMVITPGPIDWCIPTKWWQNEKCTQVDFKTLEKIGGLKIDILGVNTLNYIWGAIKNIQDRRGVTLDPWNLPHDPATFKMLTKGDTETVFQFDTHVVKPFLARMHPKTINDLVLITSIARPGCLDSKLEDGRSVAAHFEDRVSGREHVEYLDPILIPILKETYGLCVFQEQIQRIFEVVGGLSPVESDDARRAIGKKNLQVLLGIKKRLFEGARIKHGWDLEKCQSLWQSFIGASNYAWNKAHAVAYGIIAYACAYLKQNYELEWWCSVLSAVETDKIRNYLSAIGDKLQPPTVNNPSAVWTITPAGKLAPPLTLIKTIGTGAVDEIRRCAPFTSFADFHARVNKRKVNKIVMVNLILAGCFIGVPPVNWDDKGPYPPDADDPLALLETLHKLRKDKGDWTKERVDILNEEKLQPKEDGKREIVLDMAKLHSKRAGLLATTRYDYIKEYMDVIRSGQYNGGLHPWRYKYQAGDPDAKPHPKKDSHWIDDYYMLRGMDELGVLMRSKYQHPVAIVGRVTGDAAPFTYKNKKTGEQVTAFRLKIENNGEIIETILWPDQYGEADPVTIEAEALVVVVGTVVESKFRGGTPELRYMYHKRMA